MGRVKVLENVFTVMSVCLFILIISEISIAGSSVSEEIFRANQINLFFAVSFLAAAFTMRIKGRNYRR